jgi:hypothetical protein
MLLQTQQSSLQLLLDTMEAAVALLQVVRCDSCTGATRDDVFTSFLFASRRKAFELMVARWRAAK